MFPSEAALLRNNHLSHSNFLERNLHCLRREYGINRWFYDLGWFGRCALTKEDDKLPAISGVAKKYEHILKDTYVAGLWLSRLHTELLWRPKEFTATVMNPTIYRPSSYRAPSWSWASINGSVTSTLFMNQEELKSETYLAFIETLEVETIPLGEDHTGQIKDGFIKALGILQQARLYPKVEGAGLSLVKAVFEDIHKPSRVNYSPSSLPYVSFIPDVDGELGDDDICFCLPVRYARPQPGGTSTLLGDRTSGYRKPGGFQRLGVFESSTSSSLFNLMYDSSGFVNLNDNGASSSEDDTSSPEEGDGVIIHEGLPEQMNSEKDVSECGEYWEEEHYMLGVSYEWANLVHQFQARKETSEEQKRFDVSDGHPRIHGPHCLYVGEPGLVHEGVTRLEPQVITII